MPLAQHLWWCIAPDQQLRPGHAGHNGRRLWAWLHSMPYPTHQKSLVVRGLRRYRQRAPLMPSVIVGGTHWQPTSRTSWSRPGGRSLVGPIEASCSTDAGGGHTQDGFYDEVESSLLPGSREELFT
eukprot:296913-Chlamydomonas_euryale.AAC.6